MNEQKLEKNINTRIEMLQNEIYKGENLKNEEVISCLLDIEEFIDDLSLLIQSKIIHKILEYLVDFCQSESPKAEDVKKVKDVLVHSKIRCKIKKAIFNLMLYKDESKNMKYKKLYHKIKLIMKEYDDLEEELTFKPNNFIKEDMFSLELPEDYESLNLENVNVKEGYLSENIRNKATVENDNFSNSQLLNAAKEILLEEARTLDSQCQENFDEKEIDLEKIRDKKQKYILEIEKRFFMGKHQNNQLTEEDVKQFLTIWTNDQEIYMEQFGKEILPHKFKKLAADEKEKRFAEKLLSIENTDLLELTKEIFIKEKKLINFGSKEFENKRINLEFIKNRKKTFIKEIRNRLFLAEKLTNKIKIKTIDNFLKNLDQDKKIYSRKFKKEILPSKLEKFIEEKKSGQNFKEEKSKIFEIEKETEEVKKIKEDMVEKIQVIYEIKSKLKKNILLKIGFFFCPSLYELNEVMKDMLDEWNSSSIESREDVLFLLEKQMSYILRKNDSTYNLFKSNLTCANSLSKYKEIYSTLIDIRTKLSKDDSFKSLIKTNENMEEIISLKRI